MTAYKEKWILHCSAHFIILGRSARMYDASASKTNNNMVQNYIFTETFKGLWNQNIDGEKGSLIFSHRYLIITITKSNGYFVFSFCKDKAGV